MANVTLPSQMGQATTEELLNAYNKLIKEVTFILNHLDSRNITVDGITADSIRAGSIVADKIDAGAVTADKISVDELSAISANIGEITAGIITGLLIRTAEEDVYPRIDFTSSNNILEASGTLNDKISIRSDYSSGLPALVFQNLSNLMYLFFTGSAYSLITSSGIDFNLNPAGNINLMPSSIASSVRVNDWSDFESVSDGETLQQALNDKPDAGISTSVVVGDGAGGTRTLYFTKGVLVSVS